MMGDVIIVITCIYFINIVYGSDQGTVNMYDKNQIYS